MSKPYDTALDYAVDCVGESSIKQDATAELKRLRAEEAKVKKLESDLRRMLRVEGLTVEALNEEFEQAEAWRAVRACHDDAKWVGKMLPVLIEIRNQIARLDREFPKETT